MQPGLRFEEKLPPTPTRPVQPSGNGRPFPLTVAELHEMQDAAPGGGSDALVAFRLLNDPIGKPGDRGEGAAGEALAVKSRATNPDELRAEIRTHWPSLLPSFLAGGGRSLEGEGVGGDAGDAAIRDGARRYWCASVWVHSTSAALLLREDNVLDAAGMRPVPTVTEEVDMDTSLPASGVAWKELPLDAVHRDETTAPQQACIGERERRWGGQLPPAQVRARRLRKLASRFSASVPPPAFFRTCVVSITREDARRATRRCAIEEELLHEARAADAEAQEWTIWPSGMRWPVPLSWPAHVLRRPRVSRPFAHCGRAPAAAAVAVPRARGGTRTTCAYDGRCEGSYKLELDGSIPAARAGPVRFGVGAYLDRGRPFARAAPVPVAIDAAVRTRGLVARMAMGEGERPWRPPSHPMQPTDFTIVHRHAHAHAMHMPCTYTYAYAYAHMHMHMHMHICTCICICIRSMHACIYHAYATHRLASTVRRQYVSAGRAQPVATGVAVPTKQDAHAQLSALTTHRELGWFYHLKTLGVVKVRPCSFFGGLPPRDGDNGYEFGRECIVRELKALVRTGTLPPLVADLVVQHAGGAAGTTPAPPKPSASGLPWQKSKASKPPQQNPKASKGSGMLSRLRRFGRSR